MKILYFFVIAVLMCHNAMASSGKVLGFIPKADADKFYMTYSGTQWTCSSYYLSGEKPVNDADDCYIPKDSNSDVPDSAADGSGGYYVCRVGELGGHSYRSSNVICDNGDDCGCDSASVFGSTGVSYSYDAVYEVSGSTLIIYGWAQCTTAASSCSNSAWKTSGTTFTDSWGDTHTVGTWNQARLLRKWNCTICIEEEEYRCAGGAYANGSDMDWENGCSKCPQYQGSDAWSDVGNNADITKCYIDAGESFTDSVGTYEFVEQCNYAK